MEINANKYFKNNLYFSSASQCRKNVTTVKLVSRYRAYICYLGITAPQIQQKCI